MTFVGNLIVEDSAISDGAVFEFQLRLPWYRSLPLSSITHLDLVANGVDIPQGTITLEINGREFALPDLASEWQQFWFIQDAATVRVRDADLAIAPAVELAVHLALRSPYILIGPDTALETHARRSHRFDRVHEQKSAP